MRYVVFTNHWCATSPVYTTDSERGAKARAKRLTREEDMPAVVIDTLNDEAIFTTVPF